MKRIAIIVTLAVLMAIGLGGCGDAQGKNLEKEIDGVTYSLSSDWQINEKEKVISNNKEEEAYYLIEQEIVDECSSIEERKKLYSADGSDGIELREIEINGTDALLTEEPVNEIYHCEIYFYADGKEHEIWFEPDYDRKDDLEPYTEELIKGISW